MTWQPPKTWGAGLALLASQMNEFVRDQQLALKDPPTGYYNSNTLYTTTSGTFVVVDGTNFSFSLTTTGAYLMVGFIGTITSSAASALIHFSVFAAGANQGAAGGILSPAGFNVNERHNASFCWLLPITPTPAGLTRTYDLRWFTSAGTASIIGAAADSIFWAREVS